MLDLSQYETADLLRLYTNIMSELKARGVRRGMNNPVADYAESLVAQAVGATLRRPSNAGHDLVDDNGIRYEVKTRRLTNQAGGRQLSALRGLDDHKFDFLAGVLFTEDLTVYRAALIPWEVVHDRASYIKHTNAWTFMLSDSVWGIPGVRELELGGAIAQSDIAHNINARIFIYALFHQAQLPR